MVMRKITLLALWLMSGFSSFSSLSRVSEASSGTAFAQAQTPEAEQDHQGQHQDTQDHSVHEHSDHEHRTQDQDNHNPKLEDHGAHAGHSASDGTVTYGDSKHAHSDHSAHGMGFLTVKALDIAGFVSFFSFSFFVSLHCALMCAPLVCSVLGPNSHYRRKELWLYNLGRGLAYLSMGFVLGFLGEALGSWSRGLGLFLSWFIGLSLVLAALSYLFPGRWKVGVSLRGSPIRSLPGKILAKLQAKDQVKSSFYLGLMTVLLPCMTLTPALAAASGSGSAGGGLITMLAFYLGTLPVMILGPGLSGSVLGSLPQGAGRKVGALFLLVAAGITIWRGYH